MDEIAYNTADLDDGYESKLLTVPMVRKSLPLFDGLYDSMERRYPGVVEKLKFNEALKRLMDTLVTDLIEATRRRLRTQQIRSVAGVRSYSRRLVGFGPRLARENRLIKDFLHSKLYSHRRIRAEQRLIVKSVEGLFQFFVDHPSRLPHSYCDQSKREPVHRVVCGYFAGMTDHYLQEQHQKFVGRQGVRPIRAAAPSGHRVLKLIS